MTQFFKSSLFVSCLLVVSACSEDAQKPTPSDPCDDGDCSGRDDPEEGASEDDVTGSIDGGKPTLDGGKPPAKNDAATPSDAGVKSDAGKSADAAVSMDAALSSDAGSTSQDAGQVDAGKLDAGKPDATAPVVEDAGSEPTPTKDAGSEPAADAATGKDSGASTGSCTGATPHGCFTPDRDNPESCPARTPEVSSGGLLPPLGNFAGCNDGAVELGTSCDYTSAGDTATCLCVVGGRWLCNYP